MRTMLINESVNTEKDASAVKVVRIFALRNFNKTPIAVAASKSTMKLIAECKNVCSTSFAKMSAVEINPYFPGKANAFISAVDAAKIAIKPAVPF